jgi:hypothetical protein
MFGFGAESAMAKDKRIGDLPGITPAAVVGLNRAGIVTLHDLLGAEFDRVAYVVDDYNEAARLVKEARKQTDGGRRHKHAPEPLVPGPLSHNPPPSTTRHHTRAAAQPLSFMAEPPSGAPSSAESHPAGEGLLSSAMALALRGVILSGPADAESRAALARRFEACALLLSHRAGEAELAAAALVEAAEAGLITAEDVDAQCGHPLEALLEECGSLRAVPVLPSGKPPKYYLEMARSASVESRRVCAALLIVALRAGRGALPGGDWYAALLAEALEAGGPDELVAAARAAVDGMSRAAA